MPSTCTLHYYFGSPTFNLSTVTFTLTLLVSTKLPERNIPSMPKRYICCILPISQMSSKGSDLGWHLTHFSRSHKSSRPWTFLVSAILPQQNYICWVLPKAWLVCLFIQFLLAYIYMVDIKPSLHIYHAQYLYLTLLFWLSDLWPWYGDLNFACYCKITWTKRHINTKTVHLLHFANISDEFEGQWPWWTVDPLFKVR